MRGVAVMALLAFASIALADATKDVRRTADSVPDLEGKWVYSNSTPLERPDGIKTLIIDEAQAAKIDAEREARSNDLSKPAEPSEYFAQRSVERINGHHHSSIIIQPDDGRLPGTVQG